MNTTETKVASRPHVGHAQTAGASRAGSATGAVGAVGADGAAGLFAFLLTGLGEAAVSDGIDLGGALGGGAGDGNSLGGSQPLAESQADPSALSGDPTQALLAQITGAAGMLATPLAPASAAATDVAMPDARAATPVVRAARHGGPPVGSGGEAGELALNAATPGAAASESLVAAMGAVPDATPAGAATSAKAHAAMRKNPLSSPLTGVDPAGNDGTAANSNSRVEGLQRAWQATAELASARSPIPLASNITVVAPLLREHESEREGPRTSGVTHAGGFAELGTAPLAPAAPGGANASATVAASAPDIAQQFHYWINSDVQSAELQVAGLGTEPVQVQISLVGNEAQVVFRTDQAQARELLGQALGTLDEMLRAQGMTLSGGWVGGSGTGGQSSGYASPQARAGTTSGVGSLRLADAGAAGAAVVHSVSTRSGSVDCFV